MRRRSNRIDYRFQQIPKPVNDLHMVTFGGSHANQFAIQQLQLAGLGGQLFELRERQYKVSHKCRNKMMQQPRWSIPRKFSA